MSQECKDAKILSDVVWKLSHINLKSTGCSKRGSAKRLARLIGVRSSTARGTYRLVFEHSRYPHSTA